MNSTPRHSPGALWLSITGKPNTILAAPMRRFLFRRMPTVVVLNGQRQNFRALVDAIRAEFPDLTILRYTNAQRVPEGTKVASTMFQHFLDNAATEALTRRNGTPKVVGRKGRRTVWTDITLEPTRSYIVNHIAEQVAEHGVDGIAIDSFHTDLDPAPYRDGVNKSQLWPGACARILQKLRAELGDKVIWYNGIWSFGGQVDAQSALLQFADGAAVEFYGYDGRGKITSSTFEIFVQRINAALEAHPDKQFLVRGTSAGTTYFDYLTDLQQARYCYGCYLLGKTPGSFFSYGQSFQLTRLPRERTGGAALYSYFTHQLGQPNGPAQANGTGGWSRKYENGQVFVAPAEGDWQRWTLSFDAWTTTGVEHSAGSQIIVPTGDAAIMLNNHPVTPRQVIEANIADSTREWLVQSETGEHRYRFLTLSVRSTDPASAMLVRFETDDEPRPFGILELLPIGGTFDAGNLDYPYRYATKLGAAHVRSAFSYPTNGAWTEFTIDLEAECAPYPCYRVISVKAIGAARVRVIRLSEPVRITAPQSAIERASS